MPDARRFDMGERDFFIGLEMASIGMEMIADWGQGAIGERLAMLTARLAEGLQGLAEFPDARVRAPHILAFAWRANWKTWSRGSRRKTSSSRSGSAACASRRMFITTRRMSTGSSLCFGE